MLVFLGFLMRKAEFIFGHLEKLQILSNSQYVSDSSWFNRKQKKKKKN